MHKYIDNKHPNTKQILPAHHTTICPRWDRTHGHSVAIRGASHYTNVTSQSRKIYFPN